MKYQWTECGGKKDDPEVPKSDEDETDFFVLHKDIVEKLQEAIKKDEVSSAIKPELAELMKKIWTQKVGNSKTIKSIIDKVHRPDNCEFFNTPRINNQLMSYMKPEAKSQDMRLQRSQKFLSTAAISVADMLQNVMKMSLDCNENDKSAMRSTLASARKIVSDLKSNVTDAFTMLAYMNSAMVQYRKDRICRTIDHKIRSIRNIHEPDSKDLFGDDIMTKMTLAHKNYNIMMNNKWNRGSKNGSGRKDTWNYGNRRGRGRRGGNRPQRGRGGKKGGRKGGYPRHDYDYERTDNYSHGSHSHGYYDDHY